MTRQLKMWYFSTEGAEDGDGFSVHASKESAYCAAADLLRYAWVEFFTDECPIVYNKTLKEFYESVDDTMDTWKEFRNDEDAFSDVMKESYPSVKWHPWSYKIEEAGPVANDTFVSHQVKWAKEDGLKPTTAQP
jgi:hypothetical protein